MMTPTSLPLRWRPQTFDEIVGQRHIVQTLRHAVEKGRIAHCYMFSGPRGSGKTSTARILAKALNCVQGPTPLPCQQCTPCREITQGHSPDVLEIDGASNRGINEIRNLQEILRYRPLQGRYRIVIIDEVHMLTPEAFNALLKTLEEPPSYAVFVLATTEPRKVPLTIVSRCQHLEFHRIPEDEIYRRLVQVCEAESIDAEPEALRLLARATDGSLRDALSLLDQAHTYADGHITTQTVVDILGMTDPAKILKLARFLAQGQLQDALPYFHELVREGYDLKHIVDDLLDFFRILLWARLKTDEPVTLARNADTQALIDELLPILREEDVLRICQQLLDCAEKLRYSEMPLLQVELTLARICQLPRLVEVEKLLDTWIQGRPWQWDPNAPVRPIEPRQMPTPSTPLLQPEATHSPQRPSEPPSPPRKSMTDFIEWMKTHRDFALLFTHVQAWEVDDATRRVVLHVPPPWKDWMETMLQERMLTLRQAMHGMVGQVYQFVLEATESTDFKAEARSTVEADPDVQRFLQTLKGEIARIEFEDRGSD